MDSRRIFRIGYQWVLPGAVLAAIAWQFASIFGRPEVRDNLGRLELRPGWLIGSALSYLLAHTVWANFWTRLLNRHGLPTSEWIGTRAYFISQLGKYVPGKVWVIFIRVGMLGNDGRTRAIVGVTATFEALTTMATGAFVGALLLPWLALDLTAFGGQNYWLIAVGTVPAGLVLLNRLIVRVAERQNRAGAGDIPLMKFGTLLGGILQAACGWLLLGLSVWMAVRALLPEPFELNLDRFLRLTAANAIAYVVGFIALFMPAGAGIREEGMKRLLAPELVAEFGDGAAGVALYTALVLRLVWTAAEVVLVGSLLLAGKKKLAPLSGMSRALPEMTP